MPIASERPALRPDFPWSTLVSVDSAQEHQRHVDNVALSAIFHSARVSLNLDLISRMEGEEHFSDQMIVRIATDFAAEVHFKPELEVCARIARVGRTSYEIELAIFSGATLAVRCSTVNVWMDGEAPCPINETARQILTCLG